MRFTKKIVTAVLLGGMLFPLYAYSALPRFYYDKDGQLQFNGTPNEQECFNKGYYYWDGNRCRGIVPVRNCQKQGGGWYQVQIYHKYFKNVCICPRKQFWDGKSCVSNPPQNKKCVVEAWCEKKMKDIMLYITPESVKAKHCPLK